MKIAGITTRPDESWMLQIGRNEIDSAGGSLHSKRYLIIDRDTKYSEQFRRLIRDNGTKVIRLPPRSPNLNAYAERFVRSIKDECLDRIIFVGQASLRRAVSDYMQRLQQYFVECRQLARPRTTLVFGSPVTGFRNHLRIVLRDKLVIRPISLTDFCWRKCNRRTFPIMAMVITPRPLLKNPAG